MLAMLHHDLPLPHSGQSHRKHISVQSMSATNGLPLIGHIPRTVTPLGRPTPGRPALNMLELYLLRREQLSSPDRTCTDMVVGFAKATVGDMRNQWRSWLKRKPILRCRFRSTLKMKPRIVDQRKLKIGRACLLFIRANQAQAGRRSNTTPIQIK